MAAKQPLIKHQMSFKVNAFYAPIYVPTNYECILNQQHQSRVQNIRISVWPCQPAVSVGLQLMAEERTRTLNKLHYYNPKTSCSLLKQEQKYVLRCICCSHSPNLWNIWSDYKIYVKAEPRGFCSGLSHIEPF